MQTLLQTQTSFGGGQGSGFTPTVSTKPSPRSDRRYGVYLLLNELENRIVWLRIGKPFHTRKAAQAYADRVTKIHRSGPASSNPELDRVLAELAGPRCVVSRIRPKSKLVEIMPAVSLSIPGRKQVDRYWTFKPDKRYLRQVHRQVGVEAYEGPTVMAISDGKVIGTGSVGVDGYAPSIQVDEAFRGRCIGKAILNCLEQQCAAIGVAEMFYPGNDIYGFGAKLKDCPELEFLLGNGWTLHGRKGSRNAIKSINVGGAT